MEESIKLIGERLRGLREVLDIPAEEVAELCEISLDHYLKIEAGEADPSVYRLSKISKRNPLIIEKGMHSCYNILLGLEGFVVYENMNSCCVFALRTLCGERR